MSYQINFSVGSRYPVGRKVLRQRVIEVLKSKGIESAQVDIFIVGKRRMKFLNETMKHRQGITDVLSFGQRDPADEHIFPVPEEVIPHYGDIVVCYPVAVQEAARRGKLVDEMVGFYIEHGLLHLLGIHHD